MSVRTSSRMILVLPALIVGAYSLTAATPAIPPPSCTLAADTVKIGQTAVPVMVRYTEEIGDSISASVAPASKVMVTAARKGGTPLTGELTLNTEQANAGDWEITIAGAKGSCSGTLAVQVGKK